MGKLNLLIVEDNLLVGAAVRDMLKAEGHDVFVVENGEIRAHLRIVPKITGRWDLGSSVHDDRDTPCLCCFNHSL